MTTPAFEHQCRWCGVTYLVPLGMQINMSKTLDVEPPALVEIKAVGREGLDVYHVHSCRKGVPWPLFS